MWTYYTLLTDQSAEEIVHLRDRVSSGSLHPKQAKVELAKTIVAGLHGRAEADLAAAEFDRRFARGEIDESTLPVVAVELPEEGWKPLARVIVDAGMASSTSEATRKVQQGGVKLNRARVTDSRLRCEAGSLLLEVGRRAVRIELRSSGAHRGERSSG